MNPYEKGVQLAKRVRGEWDLSAPIKDVFDLLSEHGCDVVRWPMLSDVSGAMTMVPKVGPVVFVNTNRTRGHQVFTAAHELYHYLDEPAVPVRWEEVARTGNKPDVEKSADAFAAEFLMPFSGLMAVLDELGLEGEAVEVDDVIRLQVRFDVSYQSMVYRLADMGLISQRHRGRLLGERHPARRALKLGYDRKEIFGEEGPFYPRRFRRLAIEALSRGQISRRKFKELLQLDDAAFRQLVRDMGIEEQLADEDELTLDEI